MSNLDRIFAHASRLDIHDSKQGFTDSRGRYFGRFTVEANPFGGREIRRYGDDLESVLAEITQALEEAATMSDIQMEREALADYRGAQYRAISKFLHRLDTGNAILDTLKAEGIPEQEATRLARLVLFRLLGENDDLFGKRET